MKYKFTQHVPRFVSGHIPIKYEFDTLEELLTKDLFKNAAADPDFYRISVGRSPFCDKDMLILELKNGEEWWVLGYIKKDIPTKLPTWTGPSL